MRSNRAGLRLVNLGFTTRVEVVLTYLQSKKLKIMGEDRSNRKEQDVGELDEEDSKVGLQ